MASLEDFQKVEQALAAGSQAALEALCEVLERERLYPQLFEALLMRSRAALGLPLIPLGPAADLPEEVLRPHEEAIADACRRVGGLYLEAGDIAAAWPYFRALGETAPVARAIEVVEPGSQRKDLEELIEIAFHNGVHPRRGLELVLAHSGICSAITSMERSPPADRQVQEECARILVRALYRELVASVRADITRREGPPAGAAGAEGGSLSSLAAGRPWLFSDGGYHVDPSHLHAVVRLSAALTGGPEIDLALEMAEYGLRLDPLYQYRSDPPFESFYADHALYLRGRRPGAAEDNQRAAGHFREKARAARAAGDERYPMAVVLEVLVRLGRASEAVDLALELGVESWPGVNLGELCQRAGEFGKLVEASRRRGDLLGYAAGLVQARAGGGASPS